MSSNDNETQSAQAGSEAQELSPEIVSQVANRVFKLLKEEARIEYERFRPVNNHRRFGPGGR